jgi:hypothetical protein
MDQNTRKLLLRWRSLENGDGLKVAASLATFLWIAGLVFCGIVVFGVIYGLHRAVIAFAAAAMGWLIAERNAMRSRLAQWPIFKQYIDWARVHKDSDESEQAKNL